MSDTISINDGEVTSPTPFSPAAQAVLDAYQLAPIEDALTTAAVLRTTAHQIFKIQWKGRVDPDPLLNVGIAWTCDALHALANELEAGGANGRS